MLKGRYNVKVASWDVPVKLAAQVMFRLKFFEAFMNMSRSRFGWGDRTHAENMKPPSPLHIYMFSHIIEMCSREGWTRKTRPLCFTVNAEEAFFFLCHRLKPVLSCTNSYCVADESTFARLMEAELAKTNVWTRVNDEKYSTVVKLIGSDGIKSVWIKT